MTSRTSPPPRLGALAAGLLLLAGCAEPFTGTWAFRFDMNSATFEGTCEDPAPDVEDIGEEVQLVDIYALGDAQVAVLLDEWLVGTPDGDALSASWTDGVSSQEVSLTRDGLAMTGEVVREDREEPEGEACRRTLSLAAERSTSQDRRYPDDLPAR